MSDNDLNDKVVDAFLTTTQPDPGRTERVRALYEQKQRRASSFALPSETDHRGRAQYWGWEATRSLLALRDGTSTNVTLDIEHAYRCARIAGYHWTRYRKLKASMFS